MKSHWLVFIVLLLPFVVYFPHLTEFAYPRGSPYSDLTISHFPNALIVRESLDKWHEIPMWTDAILSGYPLIANPLSGLWYPLGWLVFVLDLPFAFNLTLLAHIILGGFGMHSFLRSEGFEASPALIGAITFELMPKVFGHYAAGHISLVYAVCLTPWLFWCQRKRKSALAGIFFGLIILADVRWSLYGGLFWLAYSLYLSVTSGEDLGLASFAVRVKSWVIGFGKTLGLALLIATPFLLVFGEYISLSTRSMLSSSDNLFLSLDPLELVGLFVPNFGAYAESLVYFGIIPCLMVLWVLITANIRKKYLFWVLVVGVSILFSLGENFPGTAWIFSLPVVNFLRVPSRFMLVAGFAFSILTAAGFQDWFFGARSQKKNLFKVLLWLLFPWLISWTLLFSAGGADIENRDQFLWGGLFYSIIGGLILAYIYMRISQRSFITMIFLIGLVDLIGVGYKQFDFLSLKDIMGQRKDLSIFISSSSINGRVFSTSYDLFPQGMAVVNGIEISHGVDPIQLLSYRDFSQRATGLVNQNYSVVFPAPDPDTGKINYSGFSPNPDLLGQLFVEYIVTEEPVQNDDLLLVSKLNGGYIYQNTNWLPRARFIDNNHENSIRNSVFEPNRIQVNASGPGILVLSEIMYPGWRVLVDGTEKTILLVEGLFRGVELEPGFHDVEFIFFPNLMEIGFILQLAVGMIIGVNLIRRKIQGEKRMREKSWDEND